MRAVVKPRLPMFLVTAGFSERQSDLTDREIPGRSMYCGRKKITPSVGTPSRAQLIWP